MNPETAEQLGVRLSEVRTKLVASLGLPRQLLLARMDWDRFFSSASPPGAPQPSVARSTLTRDSRRKARLRRQAQLAELFYDL